MTDLNLPAKQVATIEDLFNNKNVQRKIVAALPRSVPMSAGELTNIAMRVIRQNNMLVKCSQQSLLTCFAASAQLGLSPDPWLGLCYYVPFWSTKLNCYEATFIPGYKGLIELMRRAGTVKTVEARSVYRNEPFEINFGRSPHLSHGICDGDPGEFRGAWANFIDFEDHASFDYMSKWEIDKIMERTKSRDRQKNIIGPWMTDYPAMAIKTVIRRHSKYKAKSVEERHVEKAIYSESLAEDLGPESQRQLFLPDDTPVEPIYTAADFDEEYSDITGDPLFGKFFEVARGANTPDGLEPISDDQVKIMAVGNPDGPGPFRDAFLSWKKLQKPKKKKPAKKTAGGDKGSKQKTSGSGAQAVKGAKSSDLTGDDLYQSDEWQELMIMRDQYPDHYLDFLGVEEGAVAVEPDTLAKVNAAINYINSKLGDELPDA